VFREKRPAAGAGARTYVELKDISDIHKYKLEVVFVSFKPTLEFEQTFDYVYNTAQISQFSGDSKSKIQRRPSMEIDEIFHNKILKDSWQQKVNPVQLAEQKGTKKSSTCQSGKP
jgi:hypothetical protein